MTKKTWGLFVLVVGLGTAVLMSVVNSFAPGVEDVKDPLGRPSALSLEVIHSASEFDRLSAGLTPKHRDLAGRVQTLNTVATSLEGLVGEAGSLSGKAESVNAGTVSVRSSATPLPGLIRKVSGRAREATPVVNDLGSAVSSVTGQLESVNGGLTGIYGDLAALGPRATRIVQLLHQIEEESRRVRALGPLLSTLSGPLGSIFSGNLLTNLLHLPAAR